MAMQGSSISGVDVAGATIKINDDGFYNLIDVYKRQAQKQPAPSLRVLNPASEAGRGMTDEELARKALQAARKAGSHKGGRLSLIHI